MPSIASFCVQSDYSTFENIKLEYNNEIGIPFVFQSNSCNYLNISNENVKKINTTLIKLCYNDIIKED